MNGSIDSRIYKKTSPNMAMPASLKAYAAYFCFSKRIDSTKVLMALF